MEPETFQSLLAYLVPDPSLKEDHSQWESRKRVRFAAEGTACPIIPPPREHVKRVVHTSTDDAAMVTTAESIGAATTDAPTTVTLCDRLGTERSPPGTPHQTPAAPASDQTRVHVDAGSGPTATEAEGSFARWVAGGLDLLTCLKVAAGMGHIAYRCLLCRLGITHPVTLPSWQIIALAWGRWLEAPSPKCCGSDSVFNSAFV
jgi:hypothetical protein